MAVKIYFTRSFESYKLTKDSVANNSMEGLFAGLTSLIELDANGNIDTTGVTNMDYMFDETGYGSLYGMAVSVFSTYDLSVFNTASCTSMKGMFENTGFTSTELKLPNFDTSNVKCMDYMFSGTYIEKLDISSFDTSSVESMKYILHGTSIREINTPKKSSNITAELKDGLSMYEANSDGTIKFSGTYSYGETTPSTKYKELPKNATSSLYLKDVVEAEYSIHNNGKNIMYDDFLYDVIAYDSNRNIKTPPTVTNEGYTFDYWLDTSKGTKYDFTAATDLSRSPIILYAIWDEIQCTATFDSDGGTSIASQTIGYWDKVTKPADPVKEGYTFDGWFNNGTEYDFGQCIKKDVTLKAKWTEIKCTATFDSDGGTATDAQTIGYWDKVAKPADPVKEGYTFGGWYDGSNAFDFTQPVKKTLTIKAIWKINVYTVKYEANGGSAVKDESVDYGTLATKPSIPTKQYTETCPYDFEGWYKDADLTVLYDFSLPVKSDITLYAKWVIPNMSLTVPLSVTATLDKAGKVTFPDSSQYKIISLSKYPIYISGSIDTSSINSSLIQNPDKLGFTINGQSQLQKVKIDSNSELPITISVDEKSAGVTIGNTNAKNKLFTVNYTASY
jgi:uncharacterized repeat protein (TIGR02543 family)